MEPLNTELTTIMPMGNLFTWFNGLMGDVEASIIVIAGVIAMIIVLMVSAGGGWRMKAVLTGLVCGAGFFFAISGGALWFGEQLKTTITGTGLLISLGATS